MELLLVRSNDQKNVYGDTLASTACEPPFWIATIAAYAREQGITVDVLDAEAENQSPVETAQKIAKAKPNLIGIIVTGTNLSASTQKMNGAGTLAREIKKSCTSPIFMWGLHPSALPERTLREESIKYVIKGEGLNSICALTGSIDNEKTNNLHDIKGLYYWEDGTICGNADIDIIDINSMPSPAWELLPMNKYKAHNWHRMTLPPSGNSGGYGILSTTLGCPFNCSFCAVSALFGQQKVRFKSPQRVIDEIDILVKKYGVYYIKIIDECFVLNKNYVNEVCDLLIERNYDINIWAYARVDTVDEAILKKLRRANIRWLAYGIESVSDQVREGVSKAQYSTQSITRAIEMTKEADIYIAANFIFGLPLDDYKSMEANIKFARQLNPEWVNFNSTMAYPGSALYNDCLESGIRLPDSWLGYSQLSYECTPLPTKYLTSEQVLRFRDAAFERFFESNDAYFANLKLKFGQNGVDIINNMLKNKLGRKLLEHK